MQVNFPCTEVYPWVKHKSIPMGHFLEVNYMQTLGMDKHEFRRIRLMRIKDELCDGKAATLANRIGRSPSYVSRMLYPEGKGGKKRIADDMIDIIEEAFPGWLLDDKEQNKINPLSSCNDGDINAVRVPVFDAEGSMGRGNMQPQHDTIIGSMQLNPEWVRQNIPTVSSPKNLAVMSAYGDSMQPTFTDGDLLLVDRGVCDIKLDAVYVLAFNEELFIKRIQRRMDGSVVIKSDNPLYDPHVVENGERESLSVLGRVVWSWNGKKL